tara:strand:+ start:558 stop:1589 length:1032 start_codon:yes stop_codon:yes gene_type:complete
MRVNPNVIKSFAVSTLCSIVFLIATYPNNINADFKSTFLIDDERLSTLSYLSDDRTDRWRLSVRTSIAGDTHADILARNTDKEWGVVDGVNVNRWRHRLNVLRSNGIAPVVWMIGDDSPELVAKGLKNQIDYQSKVVSAVDDIASHYVVCLECNEYYSSAQVSTLIAELKKQTDKPIGVHLTPGVRADYVKDADIIYLQTGFNLNEQQFRKQIENALKFGKPVVVSEYNINGLSQEAKRFGDIACSYDGVIGTGNGRGQSSCQTLEWGEKKKKKWYKEYEDELIIATVATATLYAVTRYQTPLTLYATEDAYSVGVEKTLNEKHTFGVRYGNRGSMLTYNWEF